MATLVASCSVCLFSLGEAAFGEEVGAHVVTKCGHAFHQWCWDGWTGSHGVVHGVDCPKCRTLNNYTGDVVRLHLDLTDGAVELKEETKRLEDKIKELESKLASSQLPQQQSSSSSRLCYNCDSPQHTTRNCKETCYIRNHDKTTSTIFTKIETYSYKMKIPGRPAGEVISLYEDKLHTTLSKEAVQLAFGFFYFDEGCWNCGSPFHHRPSCSKELNKALHDIAKKMRDINHPPSEEELYMAFDKKFVAAFLLWKRRSKKDPRKYWVHPLLQKRDSWGEHLKVEAMLSNFPELFYSYTRLTPSHFDKVLSLTGGIIKKQDTNYRSSICPKIRLYMTLRYLATGDNFRTIATSFSVGVSTVWNVVRETIPVIWNQMETLYVKAPASVNDWNAIANGFYNLWQFPNCLGSIDGKHVVVEAPIKSGSLFHNYKGTFSIVFLATCDAHYRFTTVDIGAYGRQSDGGVFAESQIGKALNSGNLDIPAPVKLPNSNRQYALPFAFVGDAAFPLTLYMLRPYPGKQIPAERRVFNYRLSRARRVIENCFGIMAARFRVFRKPIRAYPDHVENVIKACVCLHNFLRTEEMDLSVPRRRYCPPGFADVGDNSNGQWRYKETNAFRSLGQVSHSMSQRVAKETREQLTHYFMNEGKVSWQLQSIGLE